jgi:hypothetical protein
MKTITKIILILFLGINSYAQVTPTFTGTEEIKLKIGSFEFIQSLPQGFSPQLENGTSSSIDINKGNKISVLYEYNDRIYFKYWNFKSTSPSFTKYNNDKVFSIEKEKFDQLVQPLYSRYKGVAFGAYTIPFRLRSIGGGDDFDFESSLSLQANLVFGFGSIYKQDSWFDASIGLGLTGVNLNSKNSNVTEDRTASAFTFSLGGVIKPARYANIGIFMGWDFLGQNDNEVDWKHDGNAWIGLGINVSFNEVKTEKTATNLDNK